MESSHVFTSMVGRIDEHVTEILDELDVADLQWQPNGAANPIGWLVWHLARVIDAQLADALGHDQVWVLGDWAKGFGLEADPANTGYGHTPAQVAAVRPRDVAILGAYATRVNEVAYDTITPLTASDLERIVDEHWDPPVTLGVRLISIFDDAIQHAGQAKYVKGLRVSDPR